MLEELAADPSRARVLDAHTARILTTTALAPLNALNSRELALAADRGDLQTSDCRDRLMNIADAPEKLGVKPDWLYRRHRRLPFTIPQGRMLRFSELGIEEYIRSRRGR
jgi:predicted DNA-binding transcriptional regulator AlpA